MYQTGKSGCWPAAGGASGGMGLEERTGMTTSAERLVLVAQEGEARDACLDKLRELAVPVTVFDTIRGAHDALKAQPANGVVMDFDTKLALPRPEKLLDHEISRVYPVLMIKWAGASLRVARQFSNAASMEEFVGTACTEFDARVLRSFSRKESCFNTIVSSDARFSEDNIERTVTLNISRRGCFLCSSGDAWQPGAKIWLLIKELDYRAPITGVIRWANPWGQRRYFCGIGVRFEEAPEEQIQELAHRA
jgi:hypothetical protein